MIKYVIDATGEILSQWELRDQFPNTAYDWGVGSVPAALADFLGIAVLDEVSAPVVDILSVALPDGAEKVNGVWQTKFRVTPRFADIEGGKTRQEQEDEYVAIVSANALADARELFKVQRAKDVERITVEVDGMVFDGDETSQNRMARAVVALNAASVTSTMWTLSDNSSVEVTVVQLAQALVKSGQAQTSIWTPQ
jgi:hypothetical protein